MMPRRHYRRDAPSTWSQRHPLWAAGLTAVGIMLLLVLGIIFSVLLISMLGFGYQ